MGMNRYDPGHGSAPLFLLSSALLTSLIIVFAAPAFVIHNITSGRYFLGVAVFLMLLAAAANAWYCYKGRYHLPLALFGLLPAMLVFLVSTFHYMGVTGALWTYPVALSFYMLLPGRYAWLANAVLFAVVNYEAWSLLESSVALRFTLTLLIITVSAAVFIRHVVLQQTKLEQLAITDPLTGLYNRSHLNSVVDKAIHQARRTGLPMSVLMIDIDHFKKINDVYGHQVGDTVLKALGEYFKNRLRLTDTPFRIGGDEFVVLVFNVAEGAAHQLGQEMCGDIASLQALVDHPVTVSIGVAALGPEDDMDKWMKNADRHLYLAKTNGRNQVVSNVSGESFPISGVSTPTA